MNLRRYSALIVILACLASTPVQMQASGPISVYAIVEKVVLEPNETSPERIQIWGVFSLAVGPNRTSYAKPERGYMYYKTESNVRTNSRGAWADLKRLAGTGQAVGFGGSFSNDPSGKVRKATEKPGSPDAYPAGNPVVVLGASQTAIVAQLKAALEGK